MRQVFKHANNWELRFWLKEGQITIYDIIPKFWESLTINCVMNATWDILLRFYIFKGERLQDDYIQLCKPGTYMAMQNKASMTSFIFKEFLSFSKRSISGRILLTNRHLLIVDGHSSHVTLEAIEQAHEFGLNMVTLPAHTSHALQPFDVSCLKPFKTTFRKEKDVV